mgnify:CR=1 FL=1|jgi:NAD(P) transhydrogenase subunit alpha
MIIGVPKEIMPGERRVAATPETVKSMCDMGLTVLVEKDAGEGAFFHDPEYVAAGAEIVACPREIFERADMILKVKEPLFNSDLDTHEVDLMRKGQYLITFIHPAAPVNHQMVKDLAAKGVISITLDGIPRIPRARSMDPLISMSVCAGYKGILLAVNELPKFVPQVETTVGVIKPINALIVGVGVGGWQALTTIKSLGAETYAIDIRKEATDRAEAVGAHTVQWDTPNAPDGDEMTKIKHAIAEVLPEMDIVFLSVLIPGKLAPIMITKEMVRTMKPGSVIVDISIDQGGNCELTPPGTIEKHHNVTLIGIKNIPGMIPTSSTWMFSQNVLNLVKSLIQDGEVALNLEDEVIQEALTTYQGEVVHKGALEAFALD